jgi:hypothetical protein
VTAFSDRGFFFGFVDNDRIVGLHTLERRREKICQLRTKVKKTIDIQFYTTEIA